MVSTWSFFKLILKARLTFSSSHMKMFKLNADIVHYLDNTHFIFHADHHNHGDDGHGHTHHKTPGRLIQLSSVSRLSVPDEHTAHLLINSMETDYFG